MTIDKEALRPAFERWAIDEGYAMQRTVRGDSYQDLRTQGAWDAWCAAFDSLGEPFAYFQRNIGWDSWEQVIAGAGDERGVVAAYRLPGVK